MVPPKEKENGRPGRRSKNIQWLLNCQIIAPSSSGASIIDIWNIFEFFDPLPPLSAFGTDIFYRIHATPLLHPLFHGPLPPPMRTSYLDAPLGNSQGGFMRNSTVSGETRAGLQVNGAPSSSSSSSPHSLWPPILLTLLQQLAVFRSPGKRGLRRRRRCCVGRAASRAELWWWKERRKEEDAQNVARPIRSVVGDILLRDWRTRNRSPHFVTWHTPMSRRHNGSVLIG